jgi:hypothetical protein
VVRESLLILSIVALAATGSTVGDIKRQTADAPTPASEAVKRNSGATINLTVANRRTIGLTKLDVAPAGSSAFRRIVENLGPGRKTVVALGNGENCAFDFHGVYDDGATTSARGIDLCKNGVINLFE